MIWGFPGASAGKESACNAGDPGSIPGSRRSPGERDRLPAPVFLGFPCGSDGKESSCNVEYLGSIPGLGRSHRGGYGSLLQYSCLKNPHGQRYLAGYSPWGHKQSDMTERLNWTETAAHQASWSFSISWSLLKLMFIESVMPSNHLILCCPLLFPPSVFPRIRVFSNESVVLIRWPKDWSFSFRISPSNEYSGLISFRIDWFHFLAVQGTLRSLLQHHSSKASIIWCSVFFMVQLSHLCTHTGKTIALTIWTCACKVMSVLFNMLSRLVIAFLPRCKRLLISWLQSLSAMILEP